MDSLEQKLLDIKRKKVLINQDKLNQTFFKYIGNSDWLMKINDNMYFNDNEYTFTVDLGKEQEAFLSFKESNLDFSKLPLTRNLFSLTNEILNVEFKGEVGQNLEVYLLVIEYSNQNKLKTHYININSNSEVKLDPKVRNVRVAISIRGYGDFKLDKINISGTELWLNDSLQKRGGSLIPNVNWFMTQKENLFYDKVINGIYVNSIEHPVNIIYNGNSLEKNYIENNIPVDNRPHYIYFYGKKEKDVDVKLCILYFKEDESILESIKLNESKTINIPDDAKFFKMYLEVVGKGFFNIEHLIISGYNYWPSQTIFEEDRNFAIDNPSIILKLSPDNLSGWENKGKTINLDRLKQEFHVELSGNQSLVLPFSGIDNLKSTKEKVYEILPKGTISSEVRLTLGIILDLPNEEKKVYHVKFNDPQFISFPNTILGMEIFLKVEGVGVFSNLTVEVKENPESTTNEVKLSLDKEDWFNSLDQISLVNNEEKLVINSNLESGVNKYISYRETNNTFGLSPTFSIININPNHIYEFNVRITKDDTLNFIPMIIGYNVDKKIEVQQLKVNAKTLIKPHPDVTTIRIALRVGGKGECTINSFTIKEKPIMSSGAVPNYSNKLEIAKIGVTDPKPLDKVRMAVIFDEFTETCFKYECQTIKFSPENWKEKLTLEQPDILLVESAWKGNDGTWERRIGSYGEENNRPLFELIKWCNENSIPTVFWNKEDPVHFERFIDTASHFDYVLTTDLNTVPRYVERLGHTRVGAMPFAAQPQIHNPVKFVDKRENKACFAGSYYSHHKERSIDMDSLLDAASEYGLDIYDRNFEKTSKGLMPNHTFPERFKPFIKGSLKYYEIDKAYKGYKVTMNVNTVKFSDTMFSRRVYESLACGTPVVSNHSDGIKNIFGNLVYTSDDKEELEGYFKQLLGNEQLHKKVSHLGIREVLDKHTYRNRLTDILDKVGISTYSGLPSVTVLAIANSPEDVEYLIQQFNRQEYENKKLLLLIDTFEGYTEYFNKYNDDLIQLFIKSYVIEKYPNITELVETEFISLFSKNDFYGKYYLHDLLNATQYTNADFIGKNKYYEYTNDSLIVAQNQQEYEYVTALAPASTIVRRTALSKQSLKEVYKKFETNDRYEEYYKLGHQLLSNDMFNYIKNGRYYTGSDFNIIEI